MDMLRWAFVNSFWIKTVWITEYQTVEMQAFIQGLYGWNTEPVDEVKQGGQHFFHWELEFADVFAERGGFDLVVGIIWSSYQAIQNVQNEESQAIAA